MVVFGQVPKFWLSCEKSSLNGFERTKRFPMKSELQNITISSLYFHRHVSEIREHAFSRLTADSGAACSCPCIVLVIYIYWTLICGLVDQFLLRGAQVELCSVALIRAVGITTQHYIRSTESARRCGLIWINFSIAKSKILTGVLIHKHSLDLVACHLTETLHSEVVFYLFCAPPEHQTSDTSLQHTYDGFLEI